MTNEFHSKAYHRFFEDFTEHRVLDADGKARIERIYTGKMYRPELTARGRLLHRVLYLGLYLAALILYLIAGTRRLPMNAIWYVALPEALSLFALGLLVLPVASYLTVGHDMTARLYRESSRRLQLISRIAAICLGMTALMSLAYLISDRSVGHSIEWFCIVGYVAGCVSVYWMYRLEKGVVYQLIPHAKVEKMNDTPPQTWPEEYIWDRDTDSAKPANDQSKCDSKEELA